MSGFSARWRTLAAAAREQPAPAGDAADQQERMRAIAALGLARRAEEAATGRSAGFAEWRSLALAAGLLLVTGLGLWWGGLPMSANAGTLARDLAELPRRVPRAPRLPSPGALLAQLDDLAVLHWNDPATPGGDHPSDPETRP